MSNDTQVPPAKLIAACRAGDVGAWDDLVAQYKRLVYTVPLRYGLTPAEADDVFQSVWLKLLEHLENLREPHRVAAWLVTTARRESWDRRRGSHYKNVVPAALAALPEDQWIAQTTPEELVTRYEQQQHVRQALADLNGDCRRLLQLLYFDPTEPTYAEIGEQLDMPMGSIGPTRARCLQKLRELLEA